MAHGRRQRSMAPLLIAVCAIVVGVLGTWGFALENPATPTAEHLYRALQLFAFESGDLAGSIPWQLEVARLAAPAVTATSAAIAVLALSRDRLDRLRARRRRHHVVVCGLGSSGTQAVLALRDAGHDVVGIEIDPASSGCATCRHAGIPVIVGDASNPRVLSDAGVVAAEHLVVLTPALAVGSRIALAASEVVAARSGEPLVIHVEVANARLASLLRALELTDHRGGGWRLEELDLAGLGARALVDALPPWPTGADHACVLVIADTPLGTAVEAELRRRWRHTGDPGRLTVTVLADADPHDERWAGPLDIAYVCMGDEAATIAAALAVVAGHAGTNVVAHVEHASALLELLRHDAPQLHPMSLTDAMLTPAVLLDTTVERLARALHDSYRSSAPQGDAAATDWEHLADSLKASNRSHAAAIADKLTHSGRVLVPDDGMPPDAFDPGEIEDLAQLEHQRWAEERRRAGWHPGPRDPIARTTPFLVPWDELDEEARDIDRRFVRMLPTVLADAGLVIRRVSTSSATTMRS